MGVLAVLINIWIVICVFVGAWVTTGWVLDKIAPSSEDMEDFKK